MPNIFTGLKCLEITQTKLIRAHYNSHSFFSIYLSFYLSIYISIYLIFSLSLSLFIKMINICTYFLFLPFFTGHKKCGCHSRGTGPLVSSSVITNTHRVPTGCSFHIVFFFENFKLQHKWQS